MSSKKFLLVEDDDRIAKEVEECLQPLGLNMARASDGATGVAMALEGGYSLIVLDMMLPQLGGTEVCQEVRRLDKTTPILVLSAKSDEISKVLLLELGADDYVTKPFSESELRARVKVLLRRAAQIAAGPTRPEDALTKLCYRDLEVDLERRLACFKGEALQLTATEFELLAILAQKPFHPFSRDQIRDELFGEPLVGFENTVASHISRIRKKIEPDIANPQYIVTVRGFGYSLGNPADQGQN